MKQVLSKPLTNAVRAFANERGRVEEAISSPVIECPCQLETSHCLCEFQKGRLQSTSGRIEVC